MGDSRVPLDTTWENGDAEGRNQNLNEANNSLEQTCDTILANRRRPSRSTEKTGNISDTRLGIHETRANRRRA
jgi:hypothetical protein